MVRPPRGLEEARPYAGRHNDESGPNRSELGFNWLILLQFFRKSMGMNVRNGSIVDFGNILSFQLRLLTVHRVWGFDSNRCGFRFPPIVGALSRINSRSKLLCRLIVNKLVVAVVAVVVVSISSVSRRCEHERFQAMETLVYVRSRNGTDR